MQAVSSSARSCIQKVSSTQGTLWLKYGYGLPPGEEVVLPELIAHWADRLPGLVVAWPGAIIMRPLPGTVLTAEHAVADWVLVAQHLAELMAGETARANEWLKLGLRDRRAPTWRGAVDALQCTEAFRGLASGIRRDFESLAEEFVLRFECAFESPATLVPQDSGCCNIHLTGNLPLYFDWTDVVIGHPVFSCDRLLDQAPPDYHERVVDAFIEPLGMSRAEFRAMRRSNVLHEVLRYHDELDYIRPEDPMHKALTEAVQSQLRVLVNHEMNLKSST